MVLGRAAEHGRPANVDVLNGVVKRDIRFRDGLLKGVEVYDHEINGHDAVHLHRRLMRLVAADV